MLRLIVGHLIPIGAPLTVAVDDTLFRRRGYKVYAAHWGYDGSLKVAKGNQKLSRGNTFVVAAVVVMLPFLDRPVALPVLTRLWRKGGPPKTVLARQLIERIAATTRGRGMHVVADGAYLCTELRRLPPHVTLTGPLRGNANLWHVHPDLDHPPRLRARGRPRTYGTRIGTPTDLAATMPPGTVTVTRYGRTSTVQVHHQRCLWRGVFGPRPVRVLVLIEPRKPTSPWSPPTCPHRSPTSWNATLHVGPSRLPSKTPNRPPASARPATVSVPRWNAPCPSASTPKAS